MTARTFLMLHGGAFATLLLATAFVWRRCQPPVRAAIDERGLDGVELAALTGGPERAVIAAVAALRSTNVRSGPGGTLLADGSLDADAGELERELFGAARGSPGTPARALVDAAARGPAVAGIMARLKAAGLLLDARATLLMHALWACAAVLAGIGALGLLERLGDHRIVPALASPIGALAAATAALLWWIHRHRSGASAAGRRLVDAVGRHGEGLRRRGGTAFEVAMLGSGVLWAQDWAFASALGIPTQADEQGIGGSILEFLLDGGDGCGCGCG